MDDLYGNSCASCGGMHNAVENTVAFSAEALEKGLREIYDGLDVKNVIERFIFDETLRLFNRATAEGLSENYDDKVITDRFLEQLRTNRAVFSAFRTHRMQNDIARLMTDEKGRLKPFEQFRRDVEPLTGKYCRNWLQSEYSTAVIRAHRAADWKRFEDEADVLPNLRWMPTTSPNQDPLHRQYWEKKLTLPVGHPFWDEHRPGDRWNCKCMLKQTDEPVNDDVIRDFDPVPAQPGLDGNPAEDGKIFSDAHPYFTHAYPGAEKAVKNIVGYNVQEAIARKRLTIEPDADISELEDNERCAICILKSFHKTRMTIRTHSHEKGVKNPEYLIDGLVADRKGIKSEKGVASGFQKAIGQGCKAIVIDLDKDMRRLNEKRLGTHIQWRHTDFEKGTVERCYVIYDSKAVLITKKEIMEKTVEESLKRLKP